MQINQTADRRQTSSYSTKVAVFGVLREASSTLTTTTKVSEENIKNKFIRREKR